MTLDVSAAQLRADEYRRVINELTRESERLTNELHRISAEREEIVHKLHEVTIAYRVIDALREDKK